MHSLCVLVRIGPVHTFWLQSSKDGPHIIYLGCSHGRTGILEVKRYMTTQTIDLVTSWMCLGSRHSQSMDSMRVGETMSSLLRKKTIKLHSMHWYWQCSQSATRHSGKKWMCETPSNTFINVHGWDAVFPGIRGPHFLHQTNQINSHLHLILGNKKALIWFSCFESQSFGSYFVPRVWFDEWVLRHICRSASREAWSYNGREMDLLNPQNGFGFSGVDLFINVSELFDHVQFICN